MSAFTGHSIWYSCYLFKIHLSIWYLISLSEHWLVMIFSTDALNLSGPLEYLTFWESVINPFIKWFPYKMLDTLSLLLSLHVLSLAFARALSLGMDALLLSSFSLFPVVTAPTFDFCAALFSSWRNPSFLACLSWEMKMTVDMPNCPFLLTIYVNFLKRYKSLYINIYGRELVK